MKSLIKNDKLLIDITRNSIVSKNLKNKLLNNNIKYNTSITSKDSNTSCESNHKYKKPKIIAATTNSINGVVLDSACTDSSYRISDAEAQNIQIIPANPNEILNITAAGGESIKSCAKGTIKYNENKNYDQKINIFDNERLTIGMHALNAFTNHPANCTVTLDKFGFKIIDPNYQILCEGTKDEHDKLWFMPSKMQTPTVEFASANIFVKDEPNAVFVAYQSACFLNPPDSTFENAVRKGYLGNLPRLTAKMIRNNRPNSIGTAHGHLNKLRQNIRSTKIDPVERKTDKKKLNKQTKINTNTTIPNSNIVKDSTGEQEEDDMVTKTIQLSDLSPEERKALAAYFDATGRFPFQSEEGYEYMLVSVYKNYIHVEPMIDRRAPSYVTAYRSTINFFQSKGHILSVCRLDNESSILLENFFNEEVKIEFNFIAAGNHRANKAERAIQSWKNHFIAGIATVDPDFPMTQWPNFLLQAELTLNHLRPFADNDKISAYEGIFKSKYDFQAHPIAPIGTKVVVYEPCLLYTSPSPRDRQKSRMPSSA